MLDNLVQKLVNIKWSIKLQILLDRINNEKIKLDEVSKTLSKLDKKTRTNLIEKCNNNPLVYEVLKRADEEMERTRFDNFINSVKNNTYKEYLNTLLPIQIHDLKEYTSRKTKVTSLYDNNKYNEYKIYLEILEELETYLFGRGLVDYNAIKELFKTLSIEELASYIKTYPDIFFLMDIEDDELGEKITEAAALVNTDKTIKTTDKKLIYKNSKYFKEN